ncbi:MAG: topoisomerase DNA-binding C4 zinc finger domain-containing protein [Candidatus Aenigmarchaeota archaeon]|nr:topoisomerase DNA-binding C4 zinc finger domain-containing protein [Candidatus Aenigmarchaeota archaeon]
MVSIWWWSSFFCHYTAQYKPVPDCTVCSKPMVQREAKKGKNASNKFWGCTQYPKCRGVLDI